MEVVSSLNPVRELDDFFTFMYGEQQGLVYSPLKDPETGSWDSHFFEWPAQKAQLIEHVTKNTSTREVYYGPAMYSKPQAKKENILGTYVIWAEFDGTVPESYSPIPIPTLRVQSSNPGHEHVYWRLDYFEVDVSLIEKANKSLTYALGADTSGWDATQILRPVTSLNHKRSGVRVSQLTKTHTSISVEFFAGLPETNESVRDVDLDVIPETLDVVAKYKWEPEAFKFFRRTEMAVGSRSSAMMRLGYYCAEMKMSDEEAYSILQNADARWKKFTDRSDRKRRILDIINKARVKFPLDPDLTPVDEFPVFNYGEFMASNVSIEWAIPGILQRAGLFLLSGPAGAGKTTLTLQFAIHMALGKPFLGWQIDKQNKIVFVSLEMGHADLKFFMETMSQNLTDAEKEILNTNLLLIPLGQGISLESGSVQRQVNSLLDKHAPNGIIFDSLSVSTESDLSEESGLKKVFMYVNSLRESRDVFIWFIHHNRKAQSQNKTPNKLSDVYGSFLITSQPTTVITVWPTGANHLQVIPLKVRLSRQPTPFMVERTETLQFNRLDTIMNAKLSEVVKGESDASESINKPGF